MPVRRLTLFLLLGARAAWGHSVSNELSLGLSEDSPASPHGPHIADQLTFRFELGDDWTLKIGGAYTYDTATGPPEGGAFGTSSAQILTALAGLEWEVSPRVTTYLDVSGSPRATQSFDSILPVEVGGFTVPVDVLLFNATSSVGVLGGATFVAGGTEFMGTVLQGTAIDVNVGWTLLTTSQRVDAIVDRNQQPVSRQVLQAICRALPDSKGCKAIRPYLKGGEDSLNQVSLSLGLLQPLGSTTDLGLGGAYYLYDQDPTSAVFFTARASSSAFDPSASFPLAPLRWTVSPSLQQRIGSWTLAPSYQFIDYAEGLGTAHVAALRVSLRIDGSWTVWVSGSAQWDLLSDPTTDTGTTTLVLSGRVALGFRARF